MSIIKAPPKQPKTAMIQVRVEEDIKHKLDRYAEFIDASPSYVVTEALKLLFRKDKEFKRWGGQHPMDESESPIKGGAVVATAKPS